MLIGCPDHEQARSFPASPPRRGRIDGAPRPRTPIRAIPGKASTGASTSSRFGRPGGLQARRPGSHLRHAAAARSCAQHLQQRRRPLVWRQQHAARPWPRLRQHARPLPVQHHHGVGGCFDVASANGARKIPNDFGTTLGVWGIGQARTWCCRFGSSTIRDGVGLAGDFYGRKATTPASARSTTCRCAIRCLEPGGTRAPACWTRPTRSTAWRWIRTACATPTCKRRAAMVLGQKVGDESALPNYEDDETTPRAPPPPWRRSSSPQPLAAQQGEFMQFSFFRHSSGWRLPA